MPLRETGEDLQRRPLNERRKARRKQIHRLYGAIRYSETFAASPADMIAVVREQGLEGVVAKRRDSFYEPGKTFWRLGQAAGRPPTGLCRGRIRAERAELRLYPRRLL